MDLAQESNKSFRHILYCLLLKGKTIQRRRSGVKENQESFSEQQPDQYIYIFDRLLQSEYHRVYLFIAVFIFMHVEETLVVGTRFIWLILP